MTSALIGAPFGYTSTPPTTRSSRPRCSSVVALVQRTGSAVRACGSGTVGPSLDLTRAAARACPTAASAASSSAFWRS